MQSKGFKVELIVIKFCAKKDTFYNQQKSLFYKFSPNKNTYFLNFTVHIIQIIYYVCDI